MSSRCFCNCRALQAIKGSVDTRSVSGTRTRNVTSAKSNGKRGSTSCAMKHGESLVDFRIVTVSAQKTE